MDGVLVIDKPQGITSHDVVLMLRSALHNRYKVGHTGTLDPVATGVLPLCVGKATKLSPFLMKGTKEYIATIKLGEETDTLDSEGEVLFSGTVRGDILDRIEDILDRFRGDTEQVPPSFSAIKRNGIPLYKLARKGVMVQPQPRKVSIYELKLLLVSLPYITVKVVSSPGMYVRSLCRDIGRELGCYGHMHTLRRIRSGEFTIKDGIALRDLKGMVYEDIKGAIIPMDRLVLDMPSITFNRAMEERIKKGIQPVIWADRLNCVTADVGRRLRLVSEDERLLSVAEVRTIDGRRVHLSLLKVFV